jgi:O-antigen ligase
MRNSLLKNLFVIGNTAPHRVTGRFFKRSRKYILYGIALFALAVLPSLHIMPFLKIYDQKRLFEVGMLLLAGLFFVVSRPTGKRGQPFHLSARELSFPAGNPAKWGMVLFLGLGLLSLWQNGGWYHGLQELSLYVLLFSLFFYVAKISGQIPIQFKQGIELLLLLFGGFYAFRFFIGYGLYLWGDYPLWPGWGINPALFGWANPRFFNQVQAWTLPLFVGFSTFIPFNWREFSTRANRPKILTDPSYKLEPVGSKPQRFLKSRRAFRKYFFFFLASLWWCLAIQSGGRGATLSLLVAPCIILLIFKKKSHRYIKSYLLAFVSGMITKFLLFDAFTSGGISRSLARNSGAGTNPRLNIWPKVISAIFKQPLLGWGPMSTAKMDGMIKVAHPHNSILQIAYEFGIPAMLIAAGLILWGLYKWFNKNVKNEGRFNESKNRMNLRTGISTALLAGLGYSLLSGVIVMPLSQFWMVLIAGWAFGMYGRKVHSKKQLPDFLNLSTTFIKGFVIAAIVFMSYSIIVDVPGLKQNQQYYVQHYGHYGHIFHPRFWQQGKIGLDEQK